jgi:N-hydroxyarylamine O-acetyltransferase
LPLNSDDGGEFRLVTSGRYRVLERYVAISGSWKPQYKFTLAPRTLPQFESMCHYHQTSPDSSFPRKRLATIATPEGRSTLSGQQLIRTSDGRKVEEIIAPGRISSVLLDEFGIELPVGR